ncbi:uncharacterized protein PODANS_1_12630 [Podospora anserina S mat+]|uniref:Podospora anserina S mat+ genomic DNA chromosome 1, supercontig 2 n=1 Tax=Podospora anserina (strain S / ATCC MYA-4624 / DSM 980 / FGSC 10383) TaxID=515849 RepID=B2AYY3_PODAN|nr:uncharacterized protein PODANS_1_12630 [Podospora anserina S mat+]CAP69607.1 unnamed protein product [Podospora anserina S mat+]CDP23623.1 Putative protein of unknown function [Podospora anserina S mat+]
MFAHSKPRERGSPRKVTPPSPSYMSNEQFAAYLADLRNNRINRPGGARPLPTSPTKQRDVAGLPPSRPSVGAMPASETSSLRHHHHNDSQQQGPHSEVSGIGPSASLPSMSASISSRFSAGTRGRDYYPNRPVQPLKPSDVVPSATYIERGQRWMEKEEAFSLRQAMEDMTVKDEEVKEDGAPVAEDEDEKRLYNAALDEAAELVWQHQNPGKVPQPGTPYRYKSHLRKDSYAHARTASVGMYGNDVAPTGLARNSTSASVSGSSSEGEDGPASIRSRSSFTSAHPVDSGRGSLDSLRGGSAEAQNAKTYNGVAAPAGPRPAGRRRSSLKRNISGEVQKPFSGDQIWEEPDSQEAERAEDPFPQDGKAQALQSKPKNPLNRVQFAPEAQSVAVTSPPSPQKRINRFEIHRNPPTQSRNPAYTTNSRPQAPVVREDVPRKHGIEVRSDEIRQATTMKLKDRSPALPTPSAVSDVPGRPIVSFDKNWKPHEEATDDKSDSTRSGRGIEAQHPVCLVPGRILSKQSKEAQQQAPPIPSISVSDDSPTPSPPTRRSPFRRPQPAPPTIQVDGPAVPSILVSDTSSPAAPPVPSIVIAPDDADDGPSIPVIVTPDDSASTNNSGGSRRPLPTPQPGAPRVRQAAARPRGHWTPDPRPVGSRATARCHECGHFIEGRFVSLAGSSERFHPQCFTCFSCGTSLEALEISPEPDHYRAQRLERISRRAAGEILPEKPGETEAEDGDERLRFFCHLDWHELFAPRCKHCKTPIMGEHVVALGSHWHFGHFFCAECGDPFEKGMTHIEKDGYAWCVSCQTKRTERRAPKCRACRKAVIGQYIRALGGEWHDECFRCASCHGGFDDGQIFPQEGRGAPGETVVLCTRCMEAELKA